MSSLEPLIINQSVCVFQVVDPNFMDHILRLSCQICSLSSEHLAAEICSL